MIIPTPDFDPLFANDGVPFRTKMIAYIEREFPDLLGPGKKLLKLPNGLELVAQMLNSSETHESRKAA